MFLLILLYFKQLDILFFLIFISFFVFSRKRHDTWVVYQFLSYCFSAPKLLPILYSALQEPHFCSISPQICGRVNARDLEIWVICFLYVSLISITDFTVAIILHFNILLKNSIQNKTKQNSIQTNLTVGLKQASRAGQD